VHGRHIYLSAPTVGHADEVFPLDNAAFPRVQTILLLGSAAMNTRRLGVLMAQGLGWQATSGLTLASAVAGRSVTGLYNKPDRAELLGIALADFALRPMPHGVLTCNIDQMFSKPDPREPPHLLPQARGLLHQPSILPVLLTPRPKSPTLELWEKRQDGFSAYGYARNSANLAEQSERDYQALADTLRQVPGAVRAELQPTYPWAGPAIRFTPDAETPWYRHPLVGDITVRVAYELARYLRTGSPADPGQLLGFVPGSTLARYEPTLRACTRGPAWDDDKHLRWQPTYAYPAPRTGATSPPQGHTLAIERNANEATHSRLIRRIDP